MLITFLTASTQNNRYQYTYIHTYTRSYIVCTKVCLNLNTMLSIFIRRILAFVQLALPHTWCVCLQICFASVYKYVCMGIIPHYFTSKTKDDAARADTFSPDTFMQSPQRGVTHNWVTQLQIKLGNKNCSVIKRSSVGKVVLKIGVMHRECIINVWFSINSNSRMM